MNGFFKNVDGKTREKARENGENVTLCRMMAFVASDMGWP